MDGECWSGEVAQDVPPSTRLDRYAAEYLKLLSRSQIKARGLEARINGRPVKVSRIVKPGDVLDLCWSNAPPAELIPEDLPLDIIYEDRRVIVVNKAQGMVVHPGAGNHSGTLANALLWRRLRRGGTGDSGLRPGIVHRLDKDTSGVIIAAWDDGAHAFLARQFKERQVRKTYAALVRGAPPARRGSIESLIVRDSRNRKLFTAAPLGSAAGGRRALTFYRLVRAWEDCSLLLLRPKTGRTHQIRVHLRRLGCPVLGDPLYGGGSFPAATLMLHALRLRIAIPWGPPEAGAGKIRRFAAPLPERFRALIRRLGEPLSLD
ncbi:MAG: RluA family pseudouridine synthase [Spirochaetaceae bacterium]|jgi:23S rRNA pseudouridine1911/1915/1917 synthase|nr:RluA family pseudouridine synthase [Spirochaetaceae bacterium]